MSGLEPAFQMVSKDIKTEKNASQVPECQGHSTWAYKYINSNRRDGCSGGHKTTDILSCMYFFNISDKQKHNLTNCMLAIYTFVCIS